MIKIRRPKITALEKTVNPNNRQKYLLPYAQASLKETFFLADKFFAEFIIAPFEITERQITTRIIIRIMIKINQNYPNWSNAKDEENYKCRGRAKSRATLDFDLNL